MKGCKSIELPTICIPLIGAKYHGGVRIIFKIANHLTSIGLKVILLCPRGAWSPIYKINSGIEVVLLDARNIFHYLLLLWSYFSTRKHSVFILSHWLTGFIYSLSPGVKRKNSIYFVQDSEEVFFKKSTLIGRLLRFFVFWGYRHSSNNFIVTTIYGERKLRVIVKNLSVCIHRVILGVDKQVFYPDSSAPKKNVVLFFPRRGWFKDFELLKNVFNCLYFSESLNCYEFWFVSQETDLFSSFETFDRVKFFSIKSDDELRTIYNSAKLLIHTSKYEGVCLPILEALSCGTYVIATNSFGPLTYLSRSNSRVVNIRSPEEIANLAISYLQFGEINCKDISDTVKNLSIDNFVVDFSNIILSFAMKFNKVRSS
ncbi:glycosyltransferase family 4 protein [Polynucleobacter sp. TSB-Sco08W16]|uniref:glycosyltransferase family 4 protein n=1 Tax=Polynucleobacter sp. TSB-Sco08W16 TaxID=1758374 RepID=UPI001BFD950C|nr:glycosyltransferase family 4 protein [Polynucleobacter sp. TSB-Sco08W16]QWD74563.1 glycosyltransferase family 4 protein [Polynucleobacter sp. TSB-Sco08W16]